MAFSCADWLLLVAFIIILAFILAVWRNAYFVRRGIKIQRQPLPFFGHMKEVFFNKEHLVHTLYKVYNENYGQRYTGFFAYFTPAVMFLDLDLIKQIGVKDFDHFVDHKVFLDEEAEPLLGCNMFFLRGQKWRDMRSALSPAYTSSKMKSIFPLVVDCALQTRDFISKSITQLEGGDVLEIEIKDMLTRYTNDVIASTAFGFKINSFEDRTNEFFIMGEKATNFSGWQFLKFQGYAICPSVMKFFKLALFPSDVAAYYRKLVHQTIASRESSGVSRPDMVQLLMQAKKGALQYDTDHTQGDDSRFSNVQGVSGVTKPEVVKREWSDDEITAQAVAFMIAGFGTPSSMLCFIAYELARNPDVQKKLQEEIDEVYTRTNGQPSYADLSNMKYIDMVISETLRLWPPDGLLERVCVKPYTLPPQNNSSTRTLHMGVGDECIIPIFAIHHNPDYFPDPEKFDPERFSDENKSLIKPFTYIPFGVGPRLCIGARFALMEAKALWFHISAHFDVIVTKKTTIPFTLATDTFNMHPKFGLWLGLKARNVHPLH